MTRITIVLAILGIVLLVASAVPWPVSLATVMPTPLPTPTVGTPATVIAQTTALAEQGKIIFQAKGCPTCHRHDGDFGAPNLTNYQPDPDFVRTWLKDPKAVRPGTAMPNLNLKETEIEAIIAFLSVNEVEP